MPIKMQALYCNGLTAPALGNLVLEKIAAIKIVAEHRMYSIQGRFLYGELRTMLADMLIR